MFHSKPIIFRPTTYNYRKDYGAFSNSKQMRWAVKVNIGSSLCSFKVSKQADIKTKVVERPCMIFVKT